MDVKFDLSSITIPSWTTAGYTFTSGSNRPPKPMKTRTTREQLAAAFIAVAAEDPNKITKTTAIYDGAEEHCIQGAVMAKLGYPFKRGRVVRGGHVEVSRLLNTELTDGIIPRALLMAQLANDSRLPWGFAAEMFELTLQCGEHEARARLNQRLGIKPQSKPSMHGHGVAYSWMDEIVFQNTMDNFAKSIGPVVDSLKAMNDTLTKVHVKA